MILAHTRGLLEPDYKYGVRSFIRESLILSSLEKEVQAQGYLTRAVTDVASLDIYKPEGRIAMLRSSVCNIMQGTALLQFTPYDQVFKMGSQIKDMAEIDKTMKAFKLLKKTDFYSKMHTLLKKYSN